VTASAGDRGKTDHRDVSFNLLCHGVGDSLLSVFLTSRTKPHGILSIPVIL
jgi:hypothetical protein